jgi:hypothetical protein
MKVLVVHEERTTANAISEVLRRNGHHTLPLYDAFEAVEHAEALNFDVAILGTMRATEVALGKTLRESMPRCKVVRCLERKWAGLYRALVMQNSSIWQWTRSAASRGAACIAANESRQAPTGSHI